MGSMAYFPAYFSYMRTLSALNDEEFGRVIRAGIEYAEHGTIPELSQIEMMGFAFIKEDIDRANDNYKKVCEANRRNVQKRWEEKKTDTTVYDGIRPDTTVYGRKNGIRVDTNVYESYQSKGEGESKSNSNSEGESIAADAAAPAPKKKKKAFSPPTAEEVRAYCAEAGLDTINPEAFVDYYNANGWKVGSQAMKDWKATVRNWARRDKERGITAKAEPKPEKRGSFETDDFMAAAFARTQRVMEEEERQNGENAGNSAGSGWEDYRKR